jgi:hypothetical protein
MRTESSKDEYLIRGRNGLETCLILSEEYAQLFSKRKFMERETVKDVLRRFNDSGARYCLIGGLALAHHSIPPIPRQTQDVDVLVLSEDVPQVQQLLARSRAARNRSRPDFSNRRYADRRPSCQSLGQARRRTERGRRYDG